MLKSCVALALVAAGMVGPAQAGPITFQFRDLGTFGGAASSSATDVNTLGQVIGTSGGGFVWTLQDGFTALDFTPQDINNAGVIVGDKGFKPFQRDAAGVTTQLAVPTGYADARAFAVNDAGTVVGQTSGNGQLTTGATLGASSSQAFSGSSSLVTRAGVAINNSGVVVGDARSTVGGNDFAYIRTVSNQAIPGLGTGTSRANDINDLGVVVGNVQLSGAFRSFRYSNALGVQILDLLDGTTSSAANAINGFGTIVGSSGSRAVLWDDTGVVDLNDRVNSNGFVLEFATGISEFGWIVGSGKTASGATHAFLLTPCERICPIQPPLPGVPEPASWAMMIAGFVLAGAAARHKRGAATSGA